jgi:hypothetical protein
LNPGNGNGAGPPRVAARLVEQEERAVKKWLALGVLTVAAFAAFAGSCVIVKIRLTEINGKDTFAAEMQNSSGADFLDHNYIVAFIDSGGAVVETKVVEGCLRTLQDGASDWFSADSSVSSSTTTAALARLSFDAVLKVGEAETGDVTITIDTISREGDTLTVKGKIKNNDSDELFDPAVCVVIKDNSGNIVKVAKDKNINNLSDNEEDTFELNIKVPDSTTIVDEVDVHVDGLDDSSSGKPIKPESDTGNSVTVVGDADKLQFEVQPQNTTGGVAFGTDVEVEVVDSDGDRVVSSDAEVTLAIDSGGTAGAVLTCADTSVNAVDGLATFDNCSIDKAGTGYKLKATASGLDTATSVAFNVTVGNATKLGFTTQPGGAVAGAAFTTQPVVAVQDAGGNTVTSDDTTSVTLAIGTNPADPDGVLSGCGSNPLVVTDGLAAFTTCEIDAAGTGYTLTASAASKTSATSAAFNVTAP